MAFRPFEVDDRVAFLGDSITASGRYVHMLRLFYATRFPDRPVRFYNCGIGGAGAETSWPRLDADCLALGPSMVVVMLGMNDTGNGLKRYQDAMTRIMGRVVEIPDRGLALVISCPYDQTAKLEARNQVGKNDTIREFGRWLVEQGRARHVPVIDFNMPMLKLNAAHQKENPAFSVIGKDRIHPGPPGHAVMTYCFLRDQGIRGPVARVEIDALPGSLQTTDASVKALEARDHRVSFVYTPGALPYPTEAIPFKSPDEEWVPFTEELNREWLVVHGLKKGRWVLTMDGTVVGEFSNEELDTGIDLARQTESPSYRQAHGVLAVARQVHEAEQNLRAIARVQWLILEPRGIKLDDTERANAAVRDYVAKRPQHTYWQDRAKVFFRFRAPETREAERVRMERLMNRLYEINQPKAQSVDLQLGKVQQTNPDTRRKK